MQIGFDAKRAFTNNTGLGNYSRFTINALCRYYPENSYALYTTSREQNKLYDPPPNALTCLPDTPWANQLKGFWRSYGIVKRLVRDTIELYHGLSNELPVGIEKTRVKSVVTIHDLIFMRHPEMYKPLDRKIYLAKTSNAVKSADRIIAISRQTRDDLLELLGADEEKIRIVYQGCNPWFYASAPKDKLAEIRMKYSLPGSYVLYVGTIEERKNLLDIVQAIHTHSLDIPLVAIGRKTRYFDKVRDYIEKNSVKNVIIHHHILNHDLPAIYQQAEAFIYPSSYEGFGIPVLEALNSGTPVITSRGGCLEETAGKGGLLVNPGDIEELASAIQTLLSDSELRTRLIKAGKEHALGFREEHTVPGLISIYKDCMK